MWLRRACLASLQALPGRGVVVRMTDGSGTIPWTLFRKLVPGSASLRTSPASLQLIEDEPSSESSVGWPKSGLMSGGSIYQLPPLVRITGGRGCGLWPTPKGSRAGPDYAAVESRGKSPIAGASLQTVVMALELGRWQQLPNGLVHVPAAAKTGAIGTHATEVIADVPTRGTRITTTQSSVGGIVNPAFVEWLMGFPMGWTELDASVMR